MKQTNEPSYHNLIEVLLLAGILFISWIPCFLAFYPCIYSYDVLDQMSQIIMGSYSAKHPLIHTLMIRFCYEAGFYLFHSATIGMALYALVQMAVLSVAFGYGFYTLKALGAGKWIRLLLFSWFLLFPVHGMLAVSVTKDILFTAFFVIQFVMLLRFILDPVWAGKKRSRAAYVLFLILMILFRNNALPALLLAEGILLVVWLIKKQTYMKQILVTWAVGILLSLVLLTGLRMSFHATGGDAKEALSVPLQQIARVVTLHEEELDPRVLDDLYEIFQREAIYHYEPWLVDQIKGGFSTEKYEADKAGFWKIWWKLFTAYPRDYWNAFLDNSAGAWNLLDTTHAQIYGYRPESGLGYLRSDFSYSEYEGYLGGEVRRNSHLPRVKAWYESVLVYNRYQELPVLRYLFSPALYNWLLLFLGGICLCSSRKRALTAALLPVFTLSVSVFFGPGILVRYLYPVMCCMVLFTGVCLLHGKSGNQ